MNLQCRKFAAHSWSVNARSRQQSVLRVGQLQPGRQDLSKTGVATPSTTIPPTGALSGKPVARKEGTVRAPSPIAIDTSKPFSWTACWWPVYELASLDPKIPMHVDLLGMSLVVWADTKGSWHCLEDKCPHRLAPLSEGRVEPQGLMCCYHGWTFDGNGSCTSIPQMAPDAEAAACISKRACVKSYPTMIAHGLLWVWPEAGQTEAAQSAAADLKTYIDMSNVGEWFVRDVPVRWDTFLENILDTSHVDYLHHGVVGSRYKPAAVDWEGAKVSAVTAEGYTFNLQTPGGTFALNFLAPCIARGSVGGGTLLQAIVVPTKPGWCRTYDIFAPPPVRPTVPWYFRNIQAWLNKWPVHDHLLRNEINDADVYMQHCTERQQPPSKGLGIDSLARAQYMPSSSDRPTIAFRRWIRDYAGDHIPTCTPQDEPLMPAHMPQKQALNRYDQHTKHCVHCKKALSVVDTAITVTGIVGMLAIATVVAVAVAGSAVAHLLLFDNAVAGNSAVESWWQALQATGMVFPLISSTVLAAVAFAVDSKLRNFRKKFTFKEYIHAVRD